MKSSARIFYVIQVRHVRYYEIKYLVASCGCADKLFQFKLMRKSTDI